MQQYNKWDSESDDEINYQKTLPKYQQKPLKYNSDSDNDSVHSVPKPNKYNSDDSDEEDIEKDDEIVEDDEENFIKNAIKQIEEQEKKNTLKQPDEQHQLKKLKVTTEGITQDQNKNINLQKVNGITQCYWCVTYYTNDMIITEQEDCVCKHCYFCVNYFNNDDERFKFDKECCTKRGQGIAMYILECYENHKCENCIRFPSCFLCDYKQKKEIKGIVNPDMLNIYTNGQNKNDLVDSYEFLETNKRVLFGGGFDSKVKFKIPKKIIL